MIGYKKVSFVIVTVMLIIMILTNICVYISIDYNNSRNYRVEINRSINDILNNGYDSINLNKYDYIVDIVCINDLEDEDFYSSNNDYYISRINGVLYRFEYTVNSESDDLRFKLLLIIDIFMLFILVVIISILMYIGKKIIKPFSVISEMPIELSKGNLNISVDEEKSKFFGKFIWGINMLKDTINSQKEKEMELHKEKKTLILSVSHDIKTPLSAIKLYSKALMKDLYKDKDKQKEIAENIYKNTNEIEKFLSEIIHASREDFLNLNVEIGEFYLNDLINKISLYYREKMNYLKIDFKIKDFDNCIIKGDMDRCFEIFQNIMENAIKYGDGKNIDLSVYEENEYKVVTVTNTGCMLAENEIPHIFDSFWRGSNTGNNSGSGLGLYICRQLTHKMGGEIFAECNNNIISISVVLLMA